MDKILGMFGNREMLLIVIVFLIILVFKILLMFFNSDKENKAYRNKANEEKDRRKRRAVTVNMRNSVLERDNYTCQICGISKGLLDDLCPGLGDYLLLEIDHITPVSQGGVGYEKSNLQTLCWRCNRKKSDKKTNEETKNLINYGIEYLPIDTFKEYF